ncbi:MAG: hypothetical protein R3F28_10005, partial [Candidatus Kapaibacterium sp.]
TPVSPTGRGSWRREGRGAQEPQPTKKKRGETMQDVRNEREYREWVEAKVTHSQSILVEELLKRGILSIEDVINIYDEEEEEYREVFEWWIVDSWLLDALEREGKPVLRSKYGAWWGRTTTGQNRRHDDVLQRIYRRELKEGRRRESREE